MNNKEPGYVYILTRSTSGRLHTCKNPSFHEDWVKIDKSSRPVDVRSKELANTAVPLPFEKRAQRILTLLHHEFEKVRGIECDFVRILPQELCDERRTQGHYSLRMFFQF